MRKSPNLDSLFHNYVSKGHNYESFSLLVLRLPDEQTSYEFEKSFFHKIANVTLVSFILHNKVMIL